MKAIFVINPIAGGEKKTTFRRKLDFYAQKYKFVYRVYLTIGRHDKRNIKELAKEYKPDVIVAVGGDGTLRLVAKVVMHTDMQLGLVPFGSANGMAAELEVPINKDQAMEVIFRKGVVLPIDNLRINKKHCCMHIGDVGFNAKLVKHFESEKKRGLRSYAKHFFKELRFSQSSKFIIKTDTLKRKTSAHMVAFANARRYGTGALLNPVGRINDGYFELCIIKDISFKVLLLSILLRFFARSLYHTRFAKIIRCRSATIKLRHKQRLPLQADGEILGDKHAVHIDIEPQCINMIVPMDFDPALPARATNVVFEGN
ncbi:YegS/Rv2252/BmrU family lipid kinase [Flammeovirgaceae bacterium SG7u.111]|nr:YegS/Rv2252/BmrU family lipid kinase [Flammeovirgaceae bacterium SG7u.132]WPO36147.1 YegS/Rv2252/BmrU family lipid kinase [Flammeovirgaceae bacterium SG7u.111]